MEARHVVGWVPGGEISSRCPKTAAFSVGGGENLDLAALTAAMEGCEVLFHLADKGGYALRLEHLSKDFDQNIKATFHLLEAMRGHSIRQIVVPCDRICLG